MDMSIIDLCLHKIRDTVLGINYGKWDANYTKEIYMQNSGSGILWLNEISPFHLTPQFYFVRVWRPKPECLSMTALRMQSEEPASGQVPGAQ